jgi:hypothetical protein
VSAWSRSSGRSEPHGSPRLTWCATRTRAGSRARRTRPSTGNWPRSSGRSRSRTVGGRWISRQARCAWRASRLPGGRTRAHDGLRAGGRADRASRLPPSREAHRGFPQDVGEGVRGRWAPWTPPARLPAHSGPKPRTGGGVALPRREDDRPQDRGRLPPLRHRQRAGPARGRAEARGVHGARSSGPAPCPGHESGHGCVGVIESRTLNR